MACDPFACIMSLYEQGLSRMLHSLFHARKKLRPLPITCPWNTTWDRICMGCCMVQTIAHADVWWLK